MKVVSNKISDVFDYYLGLLQQEYPKHEASSNLYLLFDHYFKLTRFNFIKEPDQRLSESELLKVHFGVKDLLTHKPVQYITGQARFWGFDFFVNPSVLIPRPETEELVELVVKDYKAYLGKAEVLEVGTGSGCIAVSLSKLIKNARVTAVDISSEALDVAARNARINNAEVVFLQVDILNPSEHSKLQKFNVIVSNPPYVRESEKEFMQKNVLNFEPGLALFVEDENPLQFYDAIAAFGKDYLTDNGHIYFEINEAFGKEMIDLMVNHQYSNIQLIKDINGKDRFLKASLIR